MQRVNKILQHLPSPKTSTKPATAATRSVASGELSWDEYEKQFDTPALSPDMPFSLDLFRLDGRVALVTGGARGIGREFVRVLADCGASVVLTATTQEGANRAVDWVVKRTNKDGKIIGIKADVSTEEGANKGVDTCISNFGRLDILVNNAGIYPYTEEVRDTTPEMIDQVFAVNVKGAFLQSKAAIPHLEKQKSGRIINISSVGALGAPKFGYYAATKGALNSLTLTLAIELKATSVTANSIAPGPIITDEFKRRLETFVDDAAVLPALRRLGTTRELAGVLIFLASDLSSYCTGQNISVDGGCHLALRDFNVE